MFTHRSGYFLTYNPRHLILFSLSLIGVLALVVIFWGSTFEFASANIMISAELIDGIIGLVSQRIPCITHNI